MRAMLLVLMLVVICASGVTGSDDENEEKIVMMRQIVLETTVGATLDDVWRVWTTTEGVTSFFAPQANVKLEVGGLFELYFAPTDAQGSRGSEDCKILSYLPKEMLSFSWNAPPSIPNLRNAGFKTWVVVRFEQLQARQVKIKLTHLGIRDGEDWDNYLAYFQNAWPRVLASCRTRFEDGPIDWNDR